MEDLTKANWRTSTWSSGNGGNCVEIAGLGVGVAVRDSKDRGGPAFVFSAGAWSGFVGVVKTGAFDLG